MLLFKMGRVLAVVGAGYDVGLSNVMPYNPKMAPEPEKHDGDPSMWFDPRPPGRNSMYPHNTYHGHTPHLRYDYLASDYELHYGINALKLLITVCVCTHNNFFVTTKKVSTP